jgi:hypothetical protein
METDQAKLQAARNADQGNLQQMMTDMKDGINVDVNANRKADREDIKEMMEEIMKANQAKTNANLKEMREEIKSGQAEIRSIVNAGIANMREDRRETMSCQVTMEACLDSKELNPKTWNPKWNIGRSIRKRLSEIFGSNEEATQRPASSCRGTRTAEGTVTRGDCGSPRKLAAEGTGRSRQEDDL